MKNMMLFYAKKNYQRRKTLGNGGITLHYGESKDMKSKKIKSKKLIFDLNGAPTENQRLTFDFKWAILKTLPGNGAESVPDLRDSPVERTKLQLNTVIWERNHRP